MPCYSTEREEKHYFYDGVGWHLMGEMRYVEEPIIEPSDENVCCCNNLTGIEHYGIKGQKFGKRERKEEEQIPMNEQFERDLGKLKAKLKKN